MWASFPSPFLYITQLPGKYQEPSGKSGYVILVTGKPNQQEVMDLPKGNPNPKQTQEFLNKQFKPVSQLPDEPLAKKPLAVKVGQSVYDLVMSMPQKERIEFLRAAIAEKIERDPQLKKTERVRTNT
jgi:hypothetical protein